MSAVLAGVLDDIFVSSQVSTEVWTSLAFLCGGVRMERACVFAKCLRSESTSVSWRKTVVFPVLPVKGRRDSRGGNDPVRTSAPTAAHRQASASDPGRHCRGGDVGPTRTFAAASPRTYMEEHEPLKEWSDAQFVEVPVLQVHKATCHLLQKEHAEAKKSCDDVWNRKVRM